MLATTALGQQDAVDFPEQPRRQGQPGLQQVQAMLERGNIVADFPHVLQRNAGHLIQLEQQQVGERRLRAFDHGGQHGLLADVHVEELRSVRQQG